MKPIRLGVDCRILSLEPIGGVLNYWHHLLRGLAVVGKRVNCIVLLYTDDPGLEPTILRHCKGDQSACIRVRCIPKRRGWYSLWLPLQTLRDRADVMILPTGRRPMWRPVPVATLIHDLCFLEVPSCYDQPRLDALTDAIRHVSSFDFVVAVSETTASQVKLRLGVPTERIVVTLEAPAMDLSCPCGEKPADLGDGIGETGYFLSVSRFDAKKNLQNMIRAFAKAKHECNLPEHLVLVGPKDEGRAELEAWVMASGADSDVRILPFVPEKGLLWLYHHATALLFPSFCEGFGLPILEAMACGCPVLTSDCSSMPEVAGRAACFVDPWSVDSMAEGIARLSLDASYRQSLRGAGLERVKEFTWEKAAERLVKGLEYALQNTRVRG